MARPHEYHGQGITGPLAPLQKPPGWRCPKCDPENMIRPAYSAPDCRRCGATMVRCEADKEAA